jgi:hypothetical protein
MAAVNDMLLSAFPSWLRADAEAVGQVLPATGLPPQGHFDAIVGGEPLAIPYRIYNPLPEAHACAALSERQRLVARCMYTRHHDGHVRERCCRPLLCDREEWVAPYVVHLLGEPVIEIGTLIRDELTGHRDIGEPFVRFAQANGPLLARTRQRAISYWDAYYRTRCPRDEYPALVVLRALMAT